MRLKLPAANSGVILRYILFAVACVLQAAVPTPASHFGHEVGVDRELLDWDKVVSYFRALEKASDKIRVEELGKTVEGRPFLAATIAAPETLRNLDRYREIQRRLADPRVTTEAELFKVCADFLSHDQPMLLEPFQLALKETDVLSGEHL